MNLENCTRILFSGRDAQPKSEGRSVQGHHFPSALRRCILASKCPLRGNAKRKRARNRPSFRFWRPPLEKRNAGFLFGLEVASRI